MKLKLNYQKQKNAFELNNIKLIIFLAQTNGNRNHQSFTVFKKFVSSKGINKIKLKYIHLTFILS